ncbi:MAG: polysaccharide pyruvyl transferase family protein [Akkermansia sp.]|nr:polysaccharide pyruvyl transferase family protein [Akkermansia sp.]
MNILDKTLSELGEFAYIRNHGNLGDMLIAMGTEQHFARKGYKHHIVHAYDTEMQEPILVHGGGARFTADWCDVDICIKLLCNSYVKKCVVLPSSFYGVDELMKHFDSRHILFCRDAKSYEYCKGKCPSSQVFLTNDMAMQLRLDELQPVISNIYPDSKEEAELQNAYNSYLRRWLKRYMNRATVTSKSGTEKKKIAFLLRNDREKKTKLHSPLTYDISASWHTAQKNRYENNLLLAFAATLRQADIIVSDRLHACLMAYHAGCEVFMLDNTYGKLKGVYELTLKKCERVHLIQEDALPQDLLKAWNKLNNPARILYYKAFDKAKKIIKHILNK